MTSITNEKLIEYISKVFKPHPWHGLDARPKDEPSLVNAYIEIVPTDRVKYEIDKESGYLMVDRPQSSPTSFHRYMVSFREHIRRTTLQSIRMRSWVEQIYSVMVTP